MKYAVVYDLELVKRFKKGQLSEIVEIGACKVDLTERAVVSDFQIYIMPGSGYFSRSTRAFINLSSEDAAKAVAFHVGMRRFADWIGGEAYLCSWGKDDKLHIVDECVRKNVSLGWFRNYNDIQGQIGRLLTDRKGQLGLKSALELAGIEPIGRAHRGIDDARNTAELLIRFADKLQLTENVLSEQELVPHDPQKRAQKRMASGAERSGPDGRSRRSRYPAGGAPKGASSPSRSSTGLADRSKPERQAVSTTEQARNPGQSPAQETSSPDSSSAAPN